ncbi:hypothetical protein Bca52824_053043 [Brassica carinata]|uniref:Uncharacterized protein n=1 Tax=Brassica carinata TaxID=52824 RepID=A0A8X7R8A4_BRACI|nr:hypothetical protein Bca52824_053043 [Brassica carinata]
MAKPPTTTRWFLMIILVLSVSTVCVILVRSTLDSCSVIIGGKISSHQFVEEKLGSAPNTLDFMRKP